MNKIVIVLLAAVFIAVGAVVAFAATGEEPEKDIPLDDMVGTVYGNSDGNFVIDQKDIDIVNDIIAGDKTLDKYPFADANCDGKVDAADVDMIKDIIAKKDMKINILDAEQKIVPVQFPVKRLIALSGTNLAPLMNVLDPYDVMVGAAYTSLDPIRDSEIIKGIDAGKITKMSNKGTAADMDIISKLNADVMISEYSSMYDLDSDENIKVLNDYGVDVLRMECRDPGDDIQTMAVFGILLGKEKEAQSYNDFVEKVYSEIEKIEGDKFGTTTSMVASSTSGFSGMDSGYINMVNLAGGKNLADGAGTTMKVEDGATWIYEDKYKADVFVLGNRLYYGADGFDAKKTAQYEEKLGKTYTWTEKSVYEYSTSIPVVIRIAYFAEAFYPDLFGEGWGDKIHQEFIDAYFDPSLNYDLPEDKFFHKLN